MPRFEYNPLLDESVIIAPLRRERSFQENDTCPFCVGAPEIPERIEGVVSLPNKFPSLSMDYEQAKGLCEVILYSSDHNIPLSDRSSKFVKEVIYHWISRHDEISKINDIQFIFIFENYGKEIGVSLEHPHGQLYAFPVVPKVIRDKLSAFQQGCIYCGGKQVIKVYQNSTFTSSVPEFAKWPFELHITPKRHLSLLHQLNDEEITDLADILKKSLIVLTKLYNKKVPYILSVFQSPIKGDISSFHLHIELISPQISDDRIKYRAGVETSLGIFINSINPVTLAPELEKLYRLSESVSIHSPGRINIIGEHTDHQGGMVLPACIQLGISIHINMVDDSIIRVYSKTYDEIDEFNPLDFDLDTGWRSYVRGVIRIFQIKTKIKTGLRIWIESDMPISSGLSSSAALEIGLLNGLYNLFNIECDDETLITLAHFVENEYVGVKCGIMDQTIVQLGREDKALLLNCASLEYEYLAIANNLKFILIDTLTERDLTKSQYNKRVEELSSALNKIQNDPRFNYPNSLSELDSKHLEVMKEILLDNEYKRVKYVITENSRVNQFCKNLEKGEFDLAGKILFQSHKSLMEDFEASWSLADNIVEYIEKTDLTGVLGARMTGAGWGGSVLVMLDKIFVESFRKHFNSWASKHLDESPLMIDISVGDGVKKINSDLNEDIVNFLDFN